PAIEIGHSITCTVTVTDTRTSTAVSGASVTWQADNAPQSGFPQLSCYTGNNIANFTSMLWTPGPCTPNATMTCATSASGSCSVVYRRLRDATGSSLAGSTVLGTHTLTLSGSVVV